jgi:outer membrane protein assembly factor BamB
VLVGDKLFVASTEGTVACIEASNGKTLWRISAGAALTAGVGSDGKTVVVGAQDGVVLAFDANNGKSRWKAQASSQILSSPAVGRGVVVVRSLDNRILALDSETGARRWFVQRPAPSLALQAAPGIVIADDTVYSALPAGRLLALSVGTGVPRWESSIAEPRGATELERVVDVSGTPVLLGKDICATSYQGRIACADIGNGALRWARELSAEVGPGIDERFVFAADERGNVHSFARANGANQWRNTSLSWRGLSAPISFSRAVVVGDKEGYLHFLSREDGAMLARLSTDGSAIKARPLIASSLLIVQTLGGKIVALSAD